jgi:4-hydroxy-tetrahydrodipicolinate synthase
MYKPYGIIPPIITPFDDEGRVNNDALSKMSTFLIDGGVHGLFPFGTTGEFYAVSDEEYVKALETVREAARGRKDRKSRPIQLIAGCSAITTRRVVELAHLAEKTGGYDAISVLTPMFIGQTQDELYRFYKTIADSTSMPVIMYNNKPKTNIGIAPATVARLAHDCENIIGVKDSTGDMTNTLEYIRLTRDIREKFSIMMGRDTLIYAGMHCGCTGAVASCANVAPRVVADIYDKFEDGDWQGALDAQFALAPLRLASTALGTFPEVIKEGLEIQGVQVGKCLEPIQALTPEEREKLKKILADMGLVEA